MKKHPEGRLNPLGANKLAESKDYRESRLTMVGMLLVVKNWCAAKRMMMEKEKGSACWQIASMLIPLMLLILLYNPTIDPKLGP